jgi:hypothetical protein
LKLRVVSCGKFDRYLDNESQLVGSRNQAFPKTASSGGEALAGLKVKLLSAGGENIHQCFAFA